MTKPIIIIGAGMAGLLAGNMLRRQPFQIVERQTSLPNNHHAVLRFRTQRVAEQVHVPFREVRVFKACDEPDPIRAAMLYSYKVTGRYEVRSLIDLAPCSRFIAPPDFIERMASGFEEGKHIAYGVDGAEFFDPRAIRDVKAIISTLPMPALMDALDYQGPRPAFSSMPGYTLSVDLPGVDVYATRYYASPDEFYYRASITANRLVIEYAGEPRSHMVSDLAGGTYRMMEVERVLADFGINAFAVSSDSVKLNVAPYAKLGALSSEDRRKAMDFMYWATTHFNIYSLGRFATWRSRLLMDDIVDDVLKIERWISGSRYDIQKGL